ncbi:MAG: hypothetical protein AAF288_00690 [Planctomycetota bacterium]
MIAGLLLVSSGCGFAVVTEPFGKPDAKLNLEGTWTLLLDGFPEGGERIRFTATPNAGQPGDYTVIMDSPDPEQRQEDGTPHQATYELLLRKHKNASLLFLRGVASTMEDQQHKLPQKHYYIHAITAGSQDPANPQVLVLWCAHPDGFKDLVNREGLRRVESSQAPADFIAIYTSDGKLEALLGEDSGRLNLTRELFATEAPWILIREAETPAD